MGANEIATAQSEKTKQIEIVYVSLDNNEVAFKQVFAEMPWYSVPYSNQTQIEALKRRVETKQLPALVILDSETNEIVSLDAREQIITPDPEITINLWDAISADR